jgi:ABC-type dipeptide/oligopeptide/nickel transport system ATPase component
MDRKCDNQQETEHARQAAALQKLKVANISLKEKISRKKFNEEKHFLFIGEKSCGKTLCIKSIFEVMNPNEKWIPNCAEYFGKCVITEQLILWEAPCSILNRIEEFTSVINGENQQLPHVDLMIVVLNPLDLNKPNYLQQIIGMVSLACRKGEYLI